MMPAHGLADPATTAADRPRAFDVTFPVLVGLMPCLCRLLRPGPRPGLELVLFLTWRGERDRPLFIAEHALVLGEPLAHAVGEALLSAASCRLVSGGVGLCCHGPARSYLGARSRHLGLVLAWAERPSPLSTLAGCLKLALNPAYLLVKPRAL